MSSVANSAAKRLLLASNLAISIMVMDAANAQSENSQHEEAGKARTSHEHATSLNAFVDATSLESLADMVVTDAKRPQPPSSVTQKIVVLHKDDIDRLPVANRNLAEQVRYTSGQFVNVLSRNDANWGSYGGLGPKYNSYLLDGIPIDSFTDAMGLDSAAIERVEIHKGPASVLYSNYLTMDFAGNEAPLAGITNFVLKNRVDKTLTRFSAGFGSWGTYSGRAYHQGSSGNLSYIVSAASESAQYTQYGTPGSWLQTISNPGYEKAQFFANLHYALNDPDHTLSLFLHHAAQDGDLGRPNRDFRHRYDTLNLAYNNRLTDAWHLQFKIGERRYDRGFANDNFPSDLQLTRFETTRQDILPMDLTVSYQHSGNSLLTMGVDYQQVHYWTENRDASGFLRRDNDARSSSTGAFIQEKIQWRDWIFRAGVRHNAIRQDYALLAGNVPETTGKTWSKNLWSLGLRYNTTPGFAVYANVGSSFMVPAAKQIGGTVSTPTASGELANPALRPESGIGADLGIDWQAMSTLSLGTRLFINTIQNAIVTNVVNTAPSQTRSDNAGKVRAGGVELDALYVASNDLSLFGNLTRTMSRIDSPGDADQDGSTTPFSPTLITNLGATSRLSGGLTVSPYLQWIGRYYDSAARSSRLKYGNYGVINIRLKQALRPGVDLVADLINVGNRRYRMPFDFRDPGFNAYAGVSVSF